MGPEAGGWGREVGSPGARGLGPGDWEALKPGNVEARDPGARGLGSSGAWKRGGVAGEQAHFGRRISSGAPAGTARATSRSADDGGDNNALARGYSVVKDLGVQYREFAGKLARLPSTRILSSGFQELGETGLKQGVTKIIFGIKLFVFRWKATFLQKTVECREWAFWASLSTAVSPKSRAS